MWEANNFSEKSHMVKHWLDKHEEENERPPFSFHVIGQFKDCLSRNLHSEDSLINSKSEYVNNCIARRTVDEGTFEKKKGKGGKKWNWRKEGENVFLCPFSKEKNPPQFEPHL